MMNKLMKYLILISSIAVFVGAIFQLQHYPFGDIVLMFGLLSHFIISSFEISRLKNKIADSEKQSL